MTQEIYDNLIALRARSDTEYELLLATGNFELEGKGGYFKRRIVLLIPEDLHVIGSHVPSSYFEEEDLTGEMDV